MAQLEPQAKVLVSEEFLESEHGEISCESCHNGNPAAKDKAGAHKDFEPHPSIKIPEQACGECHEEIVATAKTSLHATLSTFPKVLKTRTSDDKWHEVDSSRAGHCAGCHTSCGGCHVSRPKFAKKGFVDGHMFNKTSDPINQCTACHGSRVGMEYYGARGVGDVHADKENMSCESCHDAAEMHASGEGLTSRYHLEEISKCQDCHKDLQYGSVREHTIHLDKVQCQVCHSQTYVNCYSCHTGKDDKGLRYFTNQKEVEGMKIGLNHDEKAGYEYMLVRHVPTDLEMFEYYVKDAFPNFDNTPIWKRTSPHNIQRKTWQASSCNNCHGNRDLFLAEADLLDYEKGANKKVVVPDSKIPKKIEKTMARPVDTTNVRKTMVVDVEWLHKNVGKAGIAVVDVRAAGQYDKGHIEGAINLNPLAAKFRKPSDDDNPLELVSDQEILSILGDAGLKASDHIVVYGKAGTIEGFMLWILEYAGATNVSYLVDGVEGWHGAGYHFSTEPVLPKAVTFGGKIQKKYVADSEYVEDNQDNAGAKIVDVRLIHQAKGITTHGLAEKGGHIPGSVNVPIGAFFMDNGALKQPEELLWLLKTKGITPEKTVVTSCNTGQLAGGAFFILRYLGFQDVKVHDSSWVGWSAE